MRRGHWLALGAAVCVASALAGSSVVVLRGTGAAETVAEGGKQLFRFGPIRRPAESPLPENARPDADTGLTSQQALDVAPATVLGHVRDLDGKPQAGAMVVSDCALRGSVARPWLVTDKHGAFEGRFAPGSTCTLAAVREDGLLVTKSDEIPVDLEAGDKVVVDLELPAVRKGGVGLRIGEDEEGVLVLGVFDGTPAWDAGLRPGDVLVEVDGLPAKALSLEDFQAVMTGPVGTDIRFVVAYPGDTGIVEEEHTVERAFLDWTLVDGETP